MTNRLLRISLLVVACLTSGTSNSQEVAGRVLVAAGVVVIQRGADKFAARRGTEVRAGDTFQVGEKSNAQIWLTDESIIALNSNTTFKLTEYAFQKREPKQQSAFFDLLRGGFRTVTGLIGRRQRENYGVRTPTATVGIRGTNYALRYCDNDCYEGGSASAHLGPVKIAAMGDGDIGPLAQAAGEGSGTVAQNGTYGAVTDGRVNVKNQAGDFVFGADQYFFVANQKSPVRELIAPPTFLRDTLEGRASAKDKKPAAGARTAQQQETTDDGSESASTVALTGLGGGTGDVGVSGATSSPTYQSPINVNVFQVTEVAAVAAGGLSDLIVTGTGTKYYRVSGTFPVTFTESGQTITEFVNGEITLGVNYDRGLATFSVNVTDPAYPSDQANFGTFGPIIVTQSGGAATLSGQVQIRLRCSFDCPPGGEFVLLDVSGKVSGTSATLTLKYADPADPEFGQLFAEVALNEATPPNNALAAIAIPRADGGRDKRGFAGWGADVDSAGRPVHLGPTVGQPMAQVGSAQNLISGIDSQTGLTWGNWVWPGESFVDSEYRSVTPTFASTTFGVDPWITGRIPSSIPSSGTITYSPIGAVITGGYGKLNSATLTIDFLNLMAAVDINATKWIGIEAGNTFQMNGTSRVSPVTTRFENGFSSVTCSGGPCNGGAAPGGAFAGFLSGANAQGAGLAFSTGWGGVAGGINGAIALAAGAGPMMPDPQFTGVKYYNIVGPVSIPAVLNGSPTSVTMQVATIRVDYRNGVQSSWDFFGARLLLEDGGELIMRTQFGPILPATVQGKNVNFSGGSSAGSTSVVGTCESCGPGGTIGNLQYGFAVGSITGNTATFVFSGQDNSGNTRSFSANLTEIAPRTKWGGIAIPTSDGSSTLSRALMVPDSAIDGSGRLISVAAGGTANEGRGSAFVGTATNTIVGSDPSAGNLVWGTWSGAGAELIGSDFVKYTTGPTAVQPWITGTLPTAFPMTPVTYSPVGQIINNGFATLNSAVINADFVNRSMNFGVNFTRTSGELNTWNIVGGSGVDGAGRFGAGIPAANIACSGGPCTNAASATAGFEGHFSGPNAEGAGLVFSVGSGIGNGGTGVVGFKR